MIFPTWFYVAVLIPAAVFLIGEGFGWWDRYMGPRTGPSPAHPARRAPRPPKPPCPGLPVDGAPLTPAEFRKFMSVATQGQFHASVDPFNPWGAS